MWYLKYSYREFPRTDANKTHKLCTLLDANTPYSIGRSITNTFIIHHQRVSNQHLQLQIIDDGNGGQICRVNINGRYSEIGGQVLDKKKTTEIDYENDFTKDFSFKLGKDGVNFQLSNLRVFVRIPTRLVIDRDYFRRIGINLNNEVTSTTTHLVIDDRESSDLNSNIMIIDSLIRQIPIVTPLFLQEFQERHGALQSEFLGNFPDFRDFVVDSRYYPDIRRKCVFESITILITDKELYNLLKNSLEYGKCHLEFYDINEETKLGDLIDHTAALLNHTTKLLVLQHAIINHSHTDEYSISADILNNKDYKVSLLLNELCKNLELNLISTSDILTAVTLLDPDALFKKRSIVDTQEKKRKRQRIKRLDSLDFFVGGDVKTEPPALVKIPETISAITNSIGVTSQKDNTYISPLVEQVESIAADSQSFKPTTNISPKTSSKSPATKEAKASIQVKDSLQSDTKDSHEAMPIESLPEQPLQKKKRLRTRIAALPNELIENTFDPGSLKPEPSLTKCTSITQTPGGALVKINEKSESIVKDQATKYNEDKDQEKGLEMTSNEEQDEEEEETTEAQPEPEMELEPPKKTRSMASRIIQLKEQANERVKKELGISAPSESTQEDTLSKDLKNLVIIETIEIKPREPSQTQLHLQAQSQSQTQSQWSNRKNFKTFVKKLPQWKLKQLNLPVGANDPSNIRNADHLQMFLTTREYVSLTDYGARLTGAKIISKENEQILQDMESHPPDMAQLTSEEQEASFTTAPSSLRAISGTAPTQRHVGLFVEDSDSDDESGFRFSKLSNGNAIHNDDGLDMNVRVNNEQMIPEAQRLTHLDTNGNITNSAGRTNTVVDSPSVNVHKKTLLSRTHGSATSSTSSSIVSSSRSRDSTNTTTSSRYGRSNTRSVFGNRNESDSDDSDDDGAKFRFSRFKR